LYFVSSSPDLTKQLLRVSRDNVLDFISKSKKNFTTIVSILEVSTSSNTVEDFANNFESEFSTLLVELEDLFKNHPNICCDLKELLDLLSVLKLDLLRQIKELKEIIKSLKFLGMKIFLWLLYSILLVLR